MAESSSPARRDVSKPVIKIVSDWLGTDSSYEASSKNMKRFMEEYEVERVEKAQEAEQQLKEELKKQVEDQVKSTIDEHLSSWKEKQDAEQKRQQKKAHDAAVAAAVNQAKEAVGLKDTAQRLADLESEMRMLRKKDRLVSDCAVKLAALEMGEELEDEPEARKMTQARKAKKVDAAKKQGLATGPVQETPEGTGPDEEASDEDMGGDDMLEGLEARAEAMEREEAVAEPALAIKRKKSSQPDPTEEAGTWPDIPGMGFADDAWRRHAAGIMVVSVLTIASSASCLQEASGLLMPLADRQALMDWPGVDISL